ncbi:hypothetical protein C8Q74DRAFT_189688 [Fomes fomentarius]|nr:hypothetical protein C8Q74DRAFT_189688 [Fomes fomentarius]
MITNQGKMWPPARVSIRCGTGSLLGHYQRLTMKSISVAVALAAIAAFTSRTAHAQVNPLPLCVVSCVTAAGCTAGSIPDVSCICGAVTQQTIKTCVVQKCASEQDAAAGLAFLSNVCAAAP